MPASEAKRCRAGWRISPAAAPSIRTMRCSKGEANERREEKTSTARPAGACAFRPDRTEAGNHSVAARDLRRGHRGEPDLACALPPALVRLADVGHTGGGRLAGAARHSRAVLHRAPRAQPG